MKKHMCASCRNGEISLEADFFVRGNNPDGYSVRKYLCAEHLTLEEDDGAKYTTVVDLAARDAAVKLDCITRAYTGFTSFKHLCQGNPTLRPGTFPGVEFLRVEYRKATGKEACA